jgi:hypothetical protein
MSLSQENELTFLGGSGKSMDGSNNKASIGAKENQ